MTSNNSVHDPSKKSVRGNCINQDNLEAAGYNLRTSTPTHFHDLAEDTALLEKLEEKREEVKPLREKARDIEQEWEL